MVSISGIQNFKLVSSVNAKIITANLELKQEVLFVKERVLVNNALENLSVQCVQEHLKFLT